jgi:hypothetical protein
MGAALPEVGSSTDVRELLLTYLDFYRSAVDGKLSGLSDTELRTSRLPSGWTPIELLNHLIYMERRWLIWGVLGEQVAQPWGDEHDGRWTVPPGDSARELLVLLRRVATRRSSTSSPARGQPADPGDLPGSAAHRRRVRGRPVRRRNPAVGDCGALPRLPGVRAAPRPSGYCPRAGRRPRR